MANEQGVYHPKDAIAFTASTTFQIGMAGLAVAAVQNALSKENVGSLGVLSKSGGTIVTFGMVVGDRLSERRVGYRISDDFHSLRWCCVFIYKGGFCKFTRKG